MVRNGSRAGALSFSRGTVVGLDDFELSVSPKEMFSLKRGGELVVNYDRIRKLIEYSGDANFIRLAVHAAVIMFDGGIIEIDIQRLKD